MTKVIGSIPLWYENCPDSCNFKSKHFAELLQNFSVAVNKVRILCGSQMLLKMFYTP